jgi:hypothetical protein
MPGSKNCALWGVYPGPILEFLAQLQVSSFQAFGGPVLTRPHAQYPASKARTSSDTAAFAAVTSAACVL